VISSKSGSTVETLSFYRLPGDACGSRGDSWRSPIPAARSRHWRARRRLPRAVPHPPDVGGRYAALTVVGMTASRALGIDGRVLLERALAIDPGAARALGRAHRRRRGRGAGQARAAPTAAVARLRGTGSSSWWPRAREGWTRVIPVSRSLRAPVSRWRDRHGLLGRAARPGAAFVAWEYATWELCVRLGVNAFDQPDVEQAKALARAELAEAQGGGLGAQHAAPYLP